MKISKHGFLYSVVVALTLLLTTAFVEAAPSGPVTMEQAASIAKTFVGPERAPELSAGNLRTRTSFPPFGEIYQFSLPLHVTDDNGKSLEARVRVEKATGRVLEYYTDHGYKEAKSKDKEKPKSGETVSKSSALDIAQDLLTKAGVSLDGMRAEIEFSVHSPMVNFSTYSVVHTKYAEIPDIGEVALPVTALILLDAATGELYMYSLREYPVVVTMSPAVISIERAIEHVKAEPYFKEVTEVTTTRLKVDFNLDGLSQEEERMRFDERARFYEEIMTKRQRLAWEVTGKGVRVGRDRSFDFTMLVDAYTGEIFGRLLPRSL